MSKINRVVLAAAVAATLGLPVAHAANEAGTFFINPGLEFTDFDGKRDINNRMPLLTLGAGYNFTPSLAAMVSYGYANDRNGAGATEHARVARLDGLYRFFPEKDYHPYLLAGVSRVSAAGSHGALDYGMGLTYDLSDQLSVDTHVRRDHQSGNDYNDTYYGVGLTYAFGADQSTMDQGTFEGKGAMMKGDDVASTDPCQVPKANVVVHFNVNSSDVSAQDQCALQQFARYMSTHPEALATIKGYADSSGQVQYNRQLSQQRALHVEQYLARLDVSEARMKVQGLGVASPIASNKTVEGKAENRRVTADAILSAVSK